jgi:hypothetical protein
MLKVAKMVMINGFKQNIYVKNLSNMTTLAYYKSYWQLRRSEQEEIIIQLKMAVFWVVAPCSQGALMMEAARTSETLVNFYQTTRRYNPADSHLRTHRRENLRPQVIQFIIYFLFLIIIAIKYSRCAVSFQTEIAKRLNAIIAQILPFLSQEVSEWT